MQNPFQGSSLATPKGKELYEASKVLNCKVQPTGQPAYCPTAVSYTHLDVYKRQTSNCDAIEEEENVFKGLYNISDFFYNIQCNVFL